MIARLLAPIRRRKSKADRALAAARLAAAKARNDSRSIHHAQARLQSATTALLRAEMGR